MQFPISKLWYFDRMSDLGASIRAARVAIDLEAQDLAQRLGMTKSQISKIESGDRAVKAGEVIDIAEALGVSPMALLRPSSTSAQVALAARTVESTSVQSSPLMDRLRGLVDLVELMPTAPRSRGAWLSKPPAQIDQANFVRSSSALAQWARLSLGRVEAGASRFASLASALSKNLGVDVLVERFHDPATGEPDPVLGGAVVHDELHLIAVNATSIRSRALFTLAHELGHVLQGDGVRVSQDANFAATSPEERFANAFAAALLLPDDEVHAVLATHGQYLPDTVAAIMRDYDVSKQTAVYRLHNLGLMNWQNRDRLLNFRPYEFAGIIRDPGLSDYATRGGRDYLADRVVQPDSMIERGIAAYTAGIIGSAPLASLLGISVEEAIDLHGGTALNEQVNELASVDPTVLMAAETAEPLPDAYEDTPA
ncbi:hypothetical protein BJK06_08215 [Curtobacterium sp. BH-2-1-1]|uniref:helix-turn-helix domain-containing protein n=1 Tax=Curtobacterium sp. BH-2-1-1 TaxID=1905847 RepID=UPI00089DF136|nr:ImmA/IrrE family metallo-endopeptidase [Curtobacterium sp. BH-2-1-1]AOX65736.1 hypothetical protein BJK06_08215 [Curtobacterium sp. BH-2-1-1]